MKEAIAKRDAMVKREVKRGVPKAAVAKAIGASPSRVHEIVTGKKK